MLRVRGVAPASVREQQPAVAAHSELLLGRSITDSQRDPGFCFQPCGRLLVPRPAANATEVTGLPLVADAAARPANAE